MITNRILEILISIISFIILPIQFITTFLLGLLVKVTFNLLLLPISLIWIVFFYGPLLSLSYIYEKTSFLKIPVSIVGIPIALLGYIYVALLPSMGEMESRVSKLLLCHSFPFSWHLYYYTKSDENIQYSKGFTKLHEVFERIPLKDMLTHEYIIKLKATYEVARMSD